MFGKKKKVVVKTYESGSPKALAKQFEKDAAKMAKDGYVPSSVNDENVGWFGITARQIRTVTYILQEK